MSDKITCKVCGAETHIIASHLKKEHGPDSDNPVSLEKYRELYPDAPLMSEKAMRVHKSRASVAKISVDDEKTGLVKRPLHKVFDLGNIKAARTQSGDPFMIPCYENQSHPELIPEVDEGYVFNVETLKTCLMGLSTSIPTYLYGHAGVGKSSMWEQICARTGRPLLRLQHTVNTEESHVLGQWTVQKHKDEETGQIVSETIFELGPLPLAMKHGWVYLADEYDRSYPSVLSVYQAVLEGKALFIKEADEENRLIKPHPNFRFVATGNTNGAGDDSGLYPSTVTQDAATFERFGIVQEMGYMNAKEEVAIVMNQAELVEDDAKTLINFCQQIRKEFPHKVSLTIGPRSAIYIGKIGVMKADMMRGVELGFANRLPEAEREAVMQTAQRIWGAQ